MQTSAAWGALKEQLNNILLSCLAEEAKRAQAAQEAIEVCRAAGTCLHSCGGLGCLEHGLKHSLWPTESINPYSLVSPAARVMVCPQ